MELEERTIEELPDRCEECGAPLTGAEKEAVLQSDGPPLCSIHAAEVLAVDEEPELGEG